MLSGLIWVQTVCKGYLHTVVKDLRAISPFYVSELLVCVNPVFSPESKKKCFKSLDLGI